VDNITACLAMFGDMWRHVDSHLLRLYSGVQQPIYTTKMSACRERHVPIQGVVIPMPLSVPVVQVPMFTTKCGDEGECGDKGVL
jgi:hypothetical protein